MAVTSVNEIMPFGAGGSWELKASTEGDRASRSWLVELDGADDNDQALKAAMDLMGDSTYDIPDKGDAHPDWSHIRCRSVTPEATKSFRAIILTAEYSARTSSSTDPDNPTDEPWKIDFPNATDTEIVEKTKFATTDSGQEKGVGADEPIQNAAGEWIDPPIEETTYPTVIECSKNIAVGDVSASEMRTYRGSINNAAITIAGYNIPKWVGRMVGFSCMHQNNKGVEYYTLTYRILLNEDTWIRVVLNRGFHQLAGGSIEPIILTGGTAIVSKAQNLNTDGTWGESVIPNWLRFATIPEQDWSSLTVTPPTSLT